MDGLGGFWTAADQAAQLGGVAPGHAVIRIYPRRRGLLEGVSALMDRSQASLKALEGLESLMALPGVRGVVQALAEAPHGQVELKATSLPH